MFGANKHCGWKTYYKRLSSVRLSRWHILSHIYTHHRMFYTYGFVTPRKPSVKISFCLFFWFVLMKMRSFMMLWKVTNIYPSIICRVFCLFRRFNPHKSRNGKNFHVTLFSNLYVHNKYKQTYAERIEFTLYETMSETETWQGNYRNFIWNSHQTLVATSFKKEILRIWLFADTKASLRTEAQS